MNMNKRHYPLQAARRIVVGLLLLFMALPVAWGDTWDGKIATSIAKGEGTKTNPALITTAAELAYLAQQTNAREPLTVGETTIEHVKLDTYIALGADIDLDGRDWTPIGNQVNSFYGKFDGKGYCISNLKVDITGDNANGGLFGSVQEGVIQNLGVSLHKLGINVNGKAADAGGIVGYIMNGILRNCYVEGSGTVKATAITQNNAGGIAGIIQQTSLSHCYTTVNVKASNGSSYNYAGGIVGQFISDASLSYTYATGSVKALETKNYAGGICGYYSSNTPTPPSNNLALNKDINGNEDNSHRIVGRKSQNSNNLSNNYASPEIVVNGKLVDNKDANGFDGSNEKINLSNYITELRTAGPLWGDNNADTSDDPWDSSDPAKLPKLRMMVGYDENPAIYEAWPKNSQPDLTASQYLIADKIANTEGLDGSSWDKPIFIANRAELAYFAKQVNAGGKLLELANGDDINNNNNPDKEGFSAYYFALSADIDLQAREWTPIGNDNPFSGHFDGKGHVVKGLKIDISGNYVYAGLFGRTSDGEIRNLGVCLAEEGIKVECTEDVSVGGIVGDTYNTTIIRNCYVDAEDGGKIRVNTSRGSLGGIAGYLSGNGTITHCYSMVDIEVTFGMSTNIGGIVGTNIGTISHCYATGSMKGEGQGQGQAILLIGGICGRNSFNPLQNNLALNKELSGEANINRIVGESGKLAIKKNNYASSRTKINGSTITSPDPNSENGADTWLDTFKDDLRKAPATDNGWSDGKGWEWPDAPSTLLPKLMMMDANGSYSSWPTRPDQPNVEVQPDIDAANYLPAYPRLHIQSPTGVAITVTDATNTPIASNTPVRPGTQLKLAHAITQEGYSFNTYLYGTSDNQIDQPISDTYVMPNQDIWISASVSYTEPTPPEPVYHTVSLPAVEGATTNPGAGSYEVESWDNFRFYLTLDPAYSDSQPIVTTSRGETIQPRMSDGAYLVKYVRTDIDIFIAGIQPNTPTANGAIDAAATDIRAEGRTLFITVPHAAEALLCDLSGRLLQRLSLAPGQTRVDDLRPGIYIVKLSGEDGVKVIIK